MKKTTNNLKKQIINMGIKSLECNWSLFTYHEVPVPAELKELKMKLSQNKKK